MQLNQITTITWKICVQKQNKKKPRKIIQTHTRTCTYTGKKRKEQIPKYKNIMKWETWNKNRFMKNFVRQMSFSLFAQKIYNENCCVRWPRLLKGCCISLWFFSSIYCSMILRDISTNIHWCNVKYTEYNTKSIHTNNKHTYIFKHTERHTKVAAPKNRFRLPNARKRSIPPFIRLTEYVCMRVCWMSVWLQHRKRSDGFSCFVVVVGFHTLSLPLSLSSQWWFLFMYMCIYVMIAVDQRYQTNETDQINFIGVKYVRLFL